MTQNRLQVKMNNIDIEITNDSEYVIGLAYSTLNRDEINERYKLGMQDDVPYTVTFQPDYNRIG